MTKIYKYLFSVMILVPLSFGCSCKSHVTSGNENQTESDNTDQGELTVKISKNNWKLTTTANPISANVFCADPTAVEYEGRLYVYGTNDHEQYLNAEKNTYEKIKSLVCFSTEDMVNWTYHGEINVGKIAPWIYNSWAPSICSRKEADGLTHFYLYFSNSGAGSGVLTATSPLGPWTSPLNKALVYPGVKSLTGDTLTDCPNPFDPGVVIDENGAGWLSFGSGKASNGTTEFPGSARIVKLGSDMISLASDFVEIKAPYLFEASELNYINGTYVYTFNNSWDSRDTWTTTTAEASAACSMSYMTSKTPLDSDSWVYKGHYFKNPGEMGLNYSNNHTHLHKYAGEWWLFYHTLTLEERAQTGGGFRSMCVDKVTDSIDEKNVKINNCQGTRKGVSALKNLNPFETVAGTTMFTCADTWYEDIQDPSSIAVKAAKDCGWTMVKNVDFAGGTSKITLQAKGSGKILVYADSLPETIEDESKALAVINLDDASYKTVVKEFSNTVKGLHDLYFVMNKKDICFKSWSVE